MNRNPSLGREMAISGPLDDDVMAHLWRYFSSSGSERDSESSDLDDGFFFSEKEESDDIPSPEREIDDSEEPGFFPVPAAETIRELVETKSDEQIRRDLIYKVSDLKRQSKPEFLVTVMAAFREMGYNAGICKSQWESERGVLAGSYEYIDVVTSSKVRYIVDVDFAAEFDIARPTKEYGDIVSELPRVLVTRPEILRQMLRVLGEAARRSMKRRELSVPPWRKTRFMQAKWLGPYARTLNLSAPVPPMAVPSRWEGDNRCGLVGFDTAAFMSSAVV